MSAFSTQTFFDLAREPQRIGEEHLQALEEITKEYPAFSSARMLLLGGLKNTASYKFNHQLRVTAAHVHQRTALFRFVVETLERETDSKTTDAGLRTAPDHAGHGDVEMGPINPKQDAANAPATPTKSESSEAETNSLNTRETERQESEAPAATASTSGVNMEDEKAPTLPPIGSPLAFSRQEMHSFSEWLSLLEIAPVVRAEEESEEPKHIEPSEERDEQSIIARFLAAQPKIKAPERNARSESGAPIPVSQPTNQLMTETLARVYEEQGLYERAITAYEILILKYPEKSSFFADRIRELKLLTSNRA